MSSNADLGFFVSMLLALAGLFVLIFLALYIDAKRTKSERDRGLSHGRRGMNSNLSPTSMPSAPDQDRLIKFREDPTFKILWGEPVHLQPEASASALRCPVCRQDINEEQQSHACDFSCGTLYHSKCWEYLMQEGHECAVCRQHPTQ